jgi:hypothetical protein
MEGFLFTGAGVGAVGVAFELPAVLPPPHAYIAHAPMTSTARFMVRLLDE